jgi:hypothetical protein
MFPEMTCVYLSTVTSDFAHVFGWLIASRTKEGFSIQAPNVWSHVCFSTCRCVHIHRSRPRSGSACVSGALAEVLRPREGSTRLSGRKSNVTGWPGWITRVPGGRFSLEYSCGGRESVNVPRRHGADIQSRWRLRRRRSSCQSGDLSISVRPQNSCASRECVLYCVSAIPLTPTHADLISIQRRRRRHAAALGR